ncbi:inner kinetochore subunit Nkp2p [Monosporozyma servazzii]
MMKNTLLHEYFSSLLTTNLLSFNDFVTTLADSNIDATPEQMKDWYSTLQSQDDIILNQIIQEASHMLTIFKEINISDFTEREMKQYFTLETFINNLYDMGLLLDQRLAYINSEIEKYSEVLRRFYDELQLIENSTKDQGNVAIVDNLIQKLDKLKKTVQQLDK